MTTQEAWRAFEGRFVHHCAPTLAGIKPSSMYNCVVGEGPQAESVQQQTRMLVGACAEKIAHAGVSLSILLYRATGVLVFAYRPDAIARVLEHAPSCAFLRARGYDTSAPDACVDSLRNRFEEFECLRRKSGACEHCDFPHEVGLLLGYPYDDVMGFIANEGKNDLCCGHWKVYSDEQAARNMFDCFKAHTRIFDELYANGISLEELAILGRVA